MGDPPSSELAHRIADAITDRTGRIWVNDARQSLARWLDAVENRQAAVRWLTYAEAHGDDGDGTFEEYLLRRPIEHALRGPVVEDPCIEADGFTPGRRRRATWRRQDA